MNINWRVRAKNRNFWLTLIPALFLLVQALAAPFGIELDFGVLSEQMARIVNALFAVLAILGVVCDPTTEGIRDSELALTYDEPRRDY